MSKAAKSDTRKSSGVSPVSPAISTHSINDAFAEMLLPFTAKEIARRIALPSWRTVENWKQRKTSPQAKHVIAMLNDDELCAKLLEAAGRRDLAAQAEILSLNKRIDALKAAEAQHGEEAHEIRRDLAVGQQRRPMAGRQAQQGSDTLAEDRRMVSRPAD